MKKQGSNTFRKAGKFNNISKMLSLVTRYLNCFAR